MVLAVKHLYEFGPFSLDATERSLRRHDTGAVVPLTPKVLSTLLLLIENRGRILSKEEMMSALWPDTFVEESNLTFNIRKLRQALGDDAQRCVYIETVPRRGYRFKAEVKEVLAERYLETAPEVRLAALPPGERDANGEKERESDAGQAVEASLPAQPAPEVKDALTTTAQEARTAGAAIGAKRRNFFIAAALILVTLLLAAGAAAWRYNSAERNREGLLAAFAHGRVAPPTLRFEQLTFNGSTRAAAISPDGQYVAYTYEANGYESLWLRRVATSESAQLIPPADADYGQMTFGRDGTHVFYVSTASDNLNAIHRISTFGGPPVRLIGGTQNSSVVKSSFALSPDERQIAFPRRNMSTGEETLIVANIDGTNERELMRRGRPDRIDWPAWSPDGRRIMCAAGHSETSSPAMTLVEIDLESGTERVFLRPDWFNLGSLKWLPDGRSLLLRVNHRLGAQLWLVSYPDGEARQLTDDLNNYLAFDLNADTSRILAIQTKRAAHIWVSPNARESDARPVTESDDFAWTPDGRIVYSSMGGGNRDIWIMRADGSEQRQLTVGPASASWPAVSPDNRYIVFTSDRTGTQHLWRMALDGSDQTQLTHGFGEKFPALSPDSRWVYYNTVDRHSLWRIPLEGGVPERLTEGYAAFPAVSPDGRFIAYFQFAPETNERLLAVRALDDAPTVRVFQLAPGRWHSISLQWEANSGAVIYTRYNEGQVRLYRQNLAGSAPQQVAAFAAEDDFVFSWSPDRRRFAFARGNWQHDAMLIRVAE